MPETCFRARISVGPAEENCHFYIVLSHNSLIFCLARFIVLKVIVIYSFVNLDSTWHLKYCIAFYEDQYEMKIILIEPLQGLWINSIQTVHPASNRVWVCKDVYNTETNTLLFIFLLLGVGSCVPGWVFSSLESRAHAIKGAFLFVGVKLQKLEAVKAVH